MCDYGAGAGANREISEVPAAAPPDFVDSPHLDSATRAQVQQLRRMGFDPQLAEQGDLDQEHRDHWDRLHDAAKLPRREDLEVPPAPFEVPPRHIMLVIARVVHQCNNSYSAGAGVGYWDEPDDQHLDGLIAALVALLENPKLTEEELHELWRASKLAAGWTVGTAGVDYVDKTHPNLGKEFWELPEIDRYRNTMALKAMRLGWTLAGIYLPKGD